LRLHDYYAASILALAVFREDAELATQKFQDSLKRIERDDMRECFQKVLGSALGIFADGLIDQSELKNRDFLQDPQQLVGAIRDKALEPWLQHWPY